MKRHRPERGEESGHERSARAGSFAALGVTSLALLGAVAGCGAPNAANIALRKEVQTLQDQIADANHQRDAALAQVRATESGRAVQTLPVDRLEKLFTAAGLKFGRIAVGNDSDANSPGDEGVKITLTPVDQYGDEFKSAGAFTIELFDLAAADPRIGSWSISTDDARGKWISSLVIDAYVFELPWQTPPAHDTLTVRATFTDELTGRMFTAERQITGIKVPAAATTRP